MIHATAKHDLNTTSAQEFMHTTPLRKTQDLGEGTSNSNVSCEEMPLSNSQNQCPKAEVSHVTNQNIDHTENTFDSISFD